MTAPASGYYAPLAPTRSYAVGAWRLTVGTTPDGKAVVEYQSAAAPRPQRLYFETEAEAIADAEKFVGISR